MEPLYLGSRRKSSGVSVFCPNGEFFMPTSSDSKNGAAQIAGRGVEQNRRRNLYTTVTATGNLDALVPGLKAKMTFSFDSYETFQKVQQADVNVYYYNYMADVNDRRNIHTNA